MSRAGHREWNLGSLFVCLALVLAACGGEADTDTTATEPSDVAAYDTVIHPAAMQTARDIVDRFGPDEAFAAVVLALDVGYGADQIAEHANTITPDGTIPGVAPSGPGVGVFADASLRGEAIVLAAPMGLRLAARPTPLEFLTVLKNKAERGDVLTGPPSQHINDAGEVAAFIGAILSLANLGYSFDQIVEGLFLGETRLPYADNFEFECILLVERDGTVITPAGPPRAGEFYSWEEECADGIKYGGLTVLIDGKRVVAAPTITIVTTTTTTTTTTTAAAMTFPTTFAGPGTLTFTSDYTTGACVVDPVLTVTLLPEGLVEEVHETGGRSRRVDRIVPIDGDQSD